MTIVRQSHDQQVHSPALEPKMIPTVRIAARPWAAYALLTFVTMIWGGGFLATARVLHLTGPFTFLSLRFTIGAIALALIFHRRLLRITRAEVLMGSVIGLFLFGSYALQTVGLETTPSSKAGFLTSLYVPLVPLLAIPILRQLPTREAIIGVVLSFFGMLLLSCTNHFGVSIDRGEWLVIGCSVTVAFHIISIGKFAPRADAINLTIVQIIVVALGSILMLFATNEPKAVPALPVWIFAGTMGLVSTAFALVVMNRVQQTVSSTQATLIYALEPVWAGVFGFLAGERLGAPAWAGCGLILAGMIAGQIVLKPRVAKAARPLPCPPLTECG